MNNSTLKRLILVTGTNKGIGLGIIKELAKNNLNDTLIMTSRNKELGQKAFENILASSNETSLSQRLVYHQLDIDNKNSRSGFITYLSNNFKDCIDVLVNNAAISVVGDLNTDSFDKQCSLISTLLLISLKNSFKED